MTATEKTITLMWRGENYGSISGTVAFRSFIEPFPSDTADLKMRRLFGKHGFSFNQSRCSWIAHPDTEDFPIRFSEALKAAGYEVVHEGAVPTVLESPSPKM